MNTIEFAQDTEERRRWFRAASFSHPAKMVLGLQIYLIEHYTKVGETILDPMAGSGTILVGCALGRNIVCVELEKKFVKMIEANWDKIKSLGPMLGYKMGEATILQGDARQLNDLLVDKCIFSPPFADSEHNYKHGLKTLSKNFKGRKAWENKGKVDKIVTSPPYAETEGQLSADKVADPEKFAEISSRRFKQGKKKGHFATKEAILRTMEKRQKGCGENPNNIANLPYGEISAVISSPPYEGSDVSQTHMTSNKRGDPKNPNYRPSWKDKIKDGYCETKRPYADAVITSPPYEEAHNKNIGGVTDKNRPDLIPYSWTKSENQNNIGNLKSENYLEAMAQVYRQCHRVLKDGGLLCLVVKNFIRDKKIVRLDTDTIKLCEKAGFVLKERLKRKLIHQSFWRILYQKKFPDAPKIEFEDVLIFEKGV